MVFRKWTAIPLILVLTFTVYVVMNEPSPPSEITEMQEKTSV